MKTLERDHPIWQLLDDACDERLEDEGVRELESLLLDDDGLQRAYLDYCQLHTDLHLAATVEQAVGNIAATVFERGPEMSELVSYGDIYELTQPVVISPPGGGLRGRVFLSTVAVATAFYGSFILLVWTMSWSRSKPVEAPVAVLPNEDSIATKSVARYCADSNAQFGAKSASFVAGASLQAGERMQIESGVAAIEFNDGARVLVEGPAEFEPVAANEGRLQQGALIARVPQRAAGFTIATPSATVVDLGTEFGVAVSKNGSADVHVLSGRVDVQPKTTTGQKSMRLVRGQSVRIALEGDATEAVVASERFDGLRRHAQPARPVLLLRDSFHTHRTADALPDNGMNADLPSRQQGLAAPAGYVTSHGGPGRVQVNRSEEPDFLAPDQMILFPNPDKHPYVCGVLELAFPTALSLTTRCDPAVDDTDSEDWLAIGMGADSAKLNATNPLEASSGGVALAIRSNRGWMVTMNGAKVAEGMAPDGAGARGSYNVRMEIRVHQFRAWLDERPLDLNGEESEEFLELSGDADNRINFVWLAGNATHSPTPAHRGYQGHRFGPLEIHELPVSRGAIEVESTGESAPVLTEPLQRN